MATVLLLSPNPNPISSLRTPSPPAGSGELRFASPRPLPFRFRRRRAPSHRPAAAGRRSWEAEAAAAGRKDYYATLNLRRDATLQEVKSAYRTLARKYHPDMNKSPGAEEKFKEISAAYEMRSLPILSYEERRSLYDRFGEAGLQGDYGGEEVGPQGIDPYEIFNTFFGGSGELFGDNMGPGRFNFTTKVKGSRGLDIRYDLPITFEESVLGGKRDVNVSHYETCGTCDGTGAKSSSCIKQCTQCKGRGGVMKTERTPFGIFSQISTCSNCDGNGKKITEHCTSCYGSGKVQVKRIIQVDIPGGVDNGFTIQIREEGSVDKQRGVIGDLYIFLHVYENAEIRRDGLNLYSEVTVDYTEAILGTTVKVETIEGFKDLYIPPGTQPGEELKFGKMGVPHIKKPNVRGDHKFVVKVKIPKNISDTERSLVEQLASLKGTQCTSLPGEENRSRDNMRKRKNPHSSKRSKSSFWSSLRNLFGGEERGPGFAYISVLASVPQWTSCRAVTPAVPTSSINGLLILTVLLSLMSRLCCGLFLKRYDSSAHPKTAKG